MACILGFEGPVLSVWHGLCGGLTWLVLWIAWPVLSVWRGMSGTFGVACAVGLVWLYCRFCVVL